MLSKNQKTFQYLQGLIISKSSWNLTESHLKNRKKLDSQTLKDCMKSNDTDKKIPNDSFEKELQEEMVKVFHDLNEENEDSVDLEFKKKSA